MLKTLFKQEEEFIISMHKFNETYIKLSESLEKKKYIGQCDKLRKNPDNEIKWQNMMKDKKEISFAQFISSVDFTPLLDEGETAEEYIDFDVRSDSSTKAYVSHWGDDEAMFLQTAGFEFIFI